MIAYQWDITEYESSLMRYDSNYTVAHQWDIIVVIW